MPLDPIVEREYRNEAAELEQMPLRDVRHIIAMCRNAVRDPLVSQRDRADGLERVAALEKFLGLAPPPPKARKGRNSVIRAKQRAK
jgi:hypothetical protein